MKHFKLFAASIAIAIAASATVANAASVNADGTATIVAPLSLTSSAGLRFGDIAPSTTASGTVAVATNDALTCDPNLDCMGTSPVGAAAFAVAGFDSSAYNITVPASVTLNGAGTASGESMSASLNGSKTSGTLSSGADSFTVGGSLTVGANQAVGAYTGTFTVTVEYQ